MSLPLPLTDLLELLRKRKLEIGVREHLAVGRLLSRWDDPDVGSLREALAAVLARNPEEVETVRSTFDELYRPPAQEPVPPPPPQPPLRRRSPWRLALATAMALVLGLVIAVLLWPRPEPPGPQPITSQGPSQPPQGGAGTEPPERPKIPDVYPQPNRWRVLAGAASVAGALLLGLYGLRLRRAVERYARRRWHEELAERPGPHGYEIGLGDLAPPFPPAALEEVASILGQRAPTSPRYGNLDVDATIRRTLRAGLAPQVVFRTRSASPSLLVLEDIGSEMAPWKGRISALLAGLASRGVPLDRWLFHADAGRVFRALGEPEISLRQFARSHGASPLLVISAGEGILQGRDGRIAPWIEQLAAWPRRAWLHPVGDPGSWLPVLRRPERLKIHVWPMTVEGLLAISRHLGHGRPGPAARATGYTATDRPVVALDIDRLRWLLALSPRQDPELLELLRQEFCPHVPSAALPEALEAPPLTKPLGLPPEAGEVHAFLADLLAASEPEPGTAAHDRWRLDRAVQEIRVPGREERALEELVELAGGSLAAQVDDAVEDLTARARGPEPRLARPLVRELRRSVQARIRHRASRSSLGGWRRVPSPGWAAGAAALLTALLAALALPAFSFFTRDVPVHQDPRYTLRLVDSGKGPFHFEVSGPARWQDVQKQLVGRVTKRFTGFQIPFELPDSARGSLYYVRDAAPDKNGDLGISNYVPVDLPRTTPPPPPLPVAPPKKSGSVSQATGQTTDYGGKNPVISHPSSITESGFWKSNLSRKARTILVQQLGVDEEKVRPDASLIDDLGADQLDQVELVAAFENAFGIEIPDDDVERLRTVRDWINYLEKKVGTSPRLKPHGSRAPEDRVKQLADLKAQLQRLEEEIPQQQARGLVIGRDFMSSVSDIGEKLASAATSKRPDNYDLEAIAAELQSLLDQWTQMKSRPSGQEQQTAVGLDQASAERLTIEFRFDSSELGGDARAQLSALVIKLQKNPELAVRITGQSDNLESEDPRGLAARRAGIVRNYLLDREIDASRIETTVGYEPSPKTPALKETIIEVFPRSAAAQ